jgi:hypothetical protein
MKIVVNSCWGGFGLSDEAIRSYGEKYPENRNDPKLISVVEKLGEKVNDAFAALRIVEIPNKAHYIINDYDGMETVYWSMSPIHTI